MRITAEQLHDKWKSISFYDGGYSQVETQAPLEWYVGYKEINQKSVLMISAAEPELLPSSKSVLVSKGRRTDGRWALTMALLRSEQDSVFELFCADMIGFSADAGSESEALQLTYKRFKQWNRLLEHQHKSLMDESRRKGLLGEITYLSEVINAGYPVLAAVQGWVGPDGADQDFIYSDGWHEVKSVGLSADYVSISSLEQLNCEETGELVIMRIDKCAPEHSNAVSLAEAVEKVQRLVNTDSDALMLLENKLAKYGYIDLPEYREQKYHYSGKQRFVVNEDFPRLTAENVPAQIIGAQYTISIAGIDAWKVED